MNLSKRLTNPLVLLAIAAAGLALATFFGSGNDDAQVKVKIPSFSPTALAGQEAFNANCAQCHGKNGSGTKQGPPLVNDIYNPGHHPDEAFASAAANGVRRHHWNFGNMPALPQVSTEQVSKIVRYVRELQEANGIFYKPHQM